MAELSEARKRANKKWDSQNKERKQYIRNRSGAKSFILKQATEDDLVKIEEYIAERRKQLSSSIIDHR